MIDDEIRELEERLLKSEVRASAAELDRVISDEFTEFGSSGRIYTKREIIAALTADPQLQATTTVAEFHARSLAPDVVLATYRLGKSLRSSIWQRENNAWRIIFHQGTPTPA